MRKEPNSCEFSYILRLTTNLLEASSQLLHAVDAANGFLSHLFLEERLHTPLSTTRPSAASIRTS